jgi:hypothetical protein
MIRMLPMPEALALEDEDKLIKEIETRKLLRGEMVGWLYPSILEEQINRLITRLRYLREKNATAPASGAGGPTGL